MMKKMMKFAKWYVQTIERNCTNRHDNPQVLNYWRNKLFANAIISLLPLCLIALVPGLFWIHKIKNYGVGFIDILTVSLIIVIAFASGLSPTVRKIIFITISYSFSIALLLFAGLDGPALMYFLATCFFSILIFSSSNKYLSAWINTGISVVIGVIIESGLMPVIGGHTHIIGEWIAVSTNLVFLSFLFSALIPRLFAGLQMTIDKQVDLAINLKEKSEVLSTTSAALRKALDDNNKIMDSSLDVICTFDETGNFVKISKASKEVWGYEPTELIGKQSKNYIYEGDLIRDDLIHKMILEGGTIENYETNFIRKDGSQIPVSWSIRWEDKDKIAYGIARNISEKKKMEQAFEIERQKFYDLFLEAPISMGIVTGPEYIYEKANPLYLELINKQDIIGKTVREVLPAVVEQGFIRILDNVYKTGETFSAREMPIRLGTEENDDVKYLNFSYQAYKNQSNEVEGIFFFAIDVTEQVLSRKIIEINEARLNDAQKIAMLGNWEIDLLTDVHFWSDEVYHLFGLRKNEITPGKENFISFIHPEDLEEALQRIQQGFDTFENLAFNFRFIKKDGSVRYSYNEWKFIFDAEGNAIKLTGIFQDITQQHEAAQQLQDSEAFSRAILNSLTSNIAVIDFEGNIVAVNESWKSFGMENDGHPEHIGVNSNYFETCGSAIDKGDYYATESVRGINDVINNRKPLFYLEYPCHSFTEKRWFLMRVSRLEGSQSLIVVSHTDITKRKLAEIERSKAADDLVRRNKDLEQFAYIVSHNLRAPVANILGLASIWNSPVIDDDEREIISTDLLESVDKLDDVVKDLNHILQVRSELMENKEIISFSNLVEDIRTSIKNSIDTEEIDLTYDFTAVDKFSTLKSYLYSIFYNLITNSIKYRRDSVRCEIRIESNLSDDKLVLNFSDNGLGMDVLKRGEHIFGLYKRFHSHIEGKGLGLFMVKTQVEKLGGRISVESEVNKGTQFRIEFEL